MSKDNGKWYTTTSDWPQLRQKMVYKLMLHQIWHFVKFSYYTKVVFNCTLVALSVRFAVGASDVL